MPESSSLDERISFPTHRGKAIMLIDDADRPAKWYFQLKEAWLEMKETGEQFRHPMTGPVTLKWRS